MQDAWQQVRDIWLSRLSENSQRSYQHVLEIFLESIGTLALEQVSPLDVASWAESLADEGLSERTIAQRLAAVGSFYRTAIELRVMAGNPVTRQARNKLLGRKAIWLNAEQCQALLQAIDQTTLAGKRDFALLLGYLILGKRNSEWRTARVEDFSRRERTVFYAWHGKGKSGEIEVPAPVWTAVTVWLTACRRTAGPVFTAMSDLANRLPGVHDFVPGEQPISDVETNRVLKKYARRAGLDWQRIHVHTLRHSAAMLRRAAGDDVEAIRDFLQHSSLNTTQLYLHRMSGQADASWRLVSEMLGVICSDNSTYQNRRRIRVHI